MKRAVAVILLLVTVIGCMSGITLAADRPVLKTTEAGIQFIKDLEGFNARRRWDYSQYSIGYGTICGAGDYPNGITVEEADLLLRQRIAEIEQALDRFIAANNLPLATVQYDALVSFTYNVGTNWLSGCRLSRMLVEGMFTASDFASAMGVWCHAGSKLYKGLILRRIREIQLFLYGDYSGEDSRGYCYVVFDATGGSLQSDIFFYSKGTAYGALQSATKEDRKFIGWFKPDGTMLTEEETVTENLTVEARWETPQPATTAFSDISETAWYYGYVDELYNSNVISGYTDGTFRPSGTVTIGEALKLVLLACGFKEQTATDAHWASGYRNLAATNEYLPFEEITQLNDYITRDMVATLAARAMELTCPEVGESVFLDTADEDVLALYYADIIKGATDAEGNLNYYPDRTLTRAELCAIVYRIRYRN